MRLLLFILLFPAITHALPDSLPVPGGIVILPISKTTDKPAVFFKNRKVMVVKKDNQWVALIGMPLTMKQGVYNARVNLKESKPYSVTFRIKSKKYPQQHITIKNKRMVNPNNYDMKRITADRIRIKRALKHWSNNDDVQLNFQKPVKGAYSSAFGLRRFFNKQARKPHSGVDIAASKGTPLKAAANGIVIETGNYFFNGNTVFIDHGQGLISMYSHLDKIKVQTNQAVSQGEIIGLIGKTGRVTGAHLHWSVSLNNNMIDPTLFLDTSQRPQ
ncbi:MAG: M23 family metallopeptidase [Gammaproteobacteria bacterium]|nr:M23 family metallopeptidase [Gammaproteobacteria bacterium]